MSPLALWLHDPPDLGDIPLTVVSGGLGGGMRARANASHVHRVTLSPDGRHVIAERSGHYVPKTEPR
ncbi:hypothetical protein [Amycolatopsis keratiniphila]|uniref:Uncharacterized protein n=1 Tax=Amycolatopsis keratiniphila subsp. keratiniphila TaxID=227715 RepID=A0A1W2LKT7_9PSEU|nr:hypothetical protein [Amycolatopsis keratiniphila]ONF63509.1 hypothetical protein AVR91_0233770 [Amycolatopsis keratiniphila subsp. keratiniphila]